MTGQRRTHAKRSIPALPPGAALPVRVTPLSGENPEGYAQRLAVANATTWPDLRASFTPAGGKTTQRQLLILGIERAGGLPAGHFHRDRRRHQLFTRCHHHDWSRGQCRTCDLVDAPRSGCRRCAHGQDTTIYTRGGAACVRHRRWRHGGLDADLNALPQYAHAEARFSGWLWFHGVTLHTGEIDLATRLVRAALAEDHHQLLASRLSRLRVEEDAPGITALLLFYPEITSLACALTDPTVASALCTHRDLPERQTQILMGLAAGACGGAPTDELEALATEEVQRTRAALQDAFSMPASWGARVRRAARPKAMIEAGHRHQAVLMRHVDEAGAHAPVILDVKHPSISRVVSKRIQNTIRQPTAAAPSDTH